MNLKGSLPFWKMHGSGNDFVVVRQGDPALPMDDLSGFTRAICRRGTGLGADGVLIIGPSSRVDFTWRYINADGTEGEMCGNGAMVGARYAVEQGLVGGDTIFETSEGDIRAHVTGDHVQLEMIDASFVQTGLHFDAFPQTDFDLLTIGVPHVIGIVPNVDAVVDLDRIGRTIRHDSQLYPAGANVNLINKIDQHTIRMRTYERGVEAETLACGTGAVCSAISAVQHGLVQQPVVVRVSSGMDLFVSWQDDAERATRVRLAGRTRIVARGEILPEAFL